jgi:hypothetical protein
LEKNLSIASDRKFFEIPIEKITKIICYASNKIGMKEVTAHLEDHFLEFTRCKNTQNPKT